MSEFKSKTPKYQRDYMRKYRKKSKKLEKHMEENKKFTGMVKNGKFESHDYIPIPELIKTITENSKNIQEYAYDYLVNLRNKQKEPSECGHMTYLINEVDKRVSSLHKLPELETYPLFWKREFYLNSIIMAYLDEHIGFYCYDSEKFPFPDEELMSTLREMTEKNLQTLEESEGKQ